MPLNKVVFWSSYHPHPLAAGVHPEASTRAFTLGLWGAGVAGLPGVAGMRVSLFCVFLWWGWSPYRHDAKARPAGRETFTGDAGGLPVVPKCPHSRVSTFRIYRKGAASEPLL